MYLSFNNLKSWEQLCFPPLTSQDSIVQKLFLLPLTGKLSIPDCLLLELLGKDKNLLHQGYGQFWSLIRFKSHAQGRCSGTQGASTLEAQTREWKLQKLITTMTKQAYHLPSSTVRVELFSLCWCFFLKFPEGLPSVGIWGVIWCCYWNHTLSC